VLGHKDARTTVKTYAHLFDRLRTDEVVQVARAPNLNRSADKTWAEL
jgi:hypothetical protein